MMDRVAARGTQVPLDGADPSLRWFRQNAVGFDVAVEDVSEKVAALACKVPLRRTSARGCQRGYRRLEVLPCDQRRVSPASRSRSRGTGYTGDLGYEIWMPARDAVRVWDALIEQGKPFDNQPAGMLALDVGTRRSGLLLIEVDFFSSKKR